MHVFTTRGVGIFSVFTWTSIRGGSSLWWGEGEVLSRNAISRTWRWVRGGNTFYVFWELWGGGGICPHAPIPPWGFATDLRGQCLFYQSQLTSPNKKPKSLSRRSLITIASRAMWTLVWHSLEKRDGWRTSRGRDFFGSSGIVADGLSGSAGRCFVSVFSSSGLLSLAGKGKNFLAKLPLMLPFNSLSVKQTEIAVSNLCSTFDKIT